MHPIKLTDLSSLEASTRPHHGRTEMRLPITKNMEPRCGSRQPAAQYAQHTPKEKGSSVNLSIKDFHLGVLASEEKTKMKENT